MFTNAVYPISIAQVQRNLPLLQITPDTQIALLNILGDTELIEAAADALHLQLSNLPTHTIVCAETKSIPLAHALALRAKNNYIVLRKSYKSYMGKALEARTVSMTTQSEQVLYLDEKDHRSIQQQNVVIIDDVISTGSTLRAIESLMQEAQADVIARAAMFTEGDAQQWSHIISLGHLPVIRSSS
jgi:adenine phosphoribosyltransferase